VRQIRSCLRTDSMCDGFVVLEPFVHGMISGDRTQGVGGGASGGWEICIVYICIDVFVY